MPLFHGNNALADGFYGLRDEILSVHIAVGVNGGAGDLGDLGGGHGLGVG